MTESKQHIIQNSWIVWYHNPANTDWGKTSYKDIIELTSIEDYCVLKNSWNLCLPKVSEGMFFIMRKFKDGTSIFPLWEDTHNINGGCWSFKVLTESCEDIWFSLMKHVIGECLVHDTIDYSLINGISISPKKHFSIIKIWLKENNISTIQSLLDNTVKFLNVKDSIYTKHSLNIKKDRHKHTNKKYNNNKSNRQNRKKRGYFNKQDNQYRDFNNKSNNKCSW